VTAYEYNGFGEKVNQISPDGGTNQYQYLAGSLVLETTADGTVRQLKYDVLNRLIGISENFQLVFSYIYDNCNYGIGKLCQTQQDDNNHTRYSYQPSGQLFEQRSTINGDEYVQQWQYDLNGNITERYMPSGQRVKSWYNRNNRLSYINYNDKALGWDFDYLAFGPVKAWTSANHLQHGVEYTKQRQVSQIVTSNVQHLQYQYDEVGNITAWFNHAQQFNQSFGYDALGQITSIDNSDGWQDISYD
ncbi:hypothetical protein L2755_22030, partial [Shewanella abyssi]|uniref:hypothetical protein n=1 Tax=Shewanella abyssi TaxID=311789 RepID=UPI002010A462